MILPKVSFFYGRLKLYIQSKKILTKKYCKSLGPTHFSLAFRGLPFSLKFLMNENDKKNSFTYRLSTYKGITKNLQNTAL